VFEHRNSDALQAAKVQVASVFVPTPTERASGCCGKLGFQGKSGGSGGRGGDDYRGVVLGCVICSLASKESENLYHYTTGNHYVHGEHERLNKSSEHLSERSSTIPRSRGRVRRHFVYSLRL
jgi:hypothetical protein